MRRIIERVVTVVTTTTWKISWETEPPPSGAVVDSGAQLRDPEIPQGKSAPVVVQAKEVDGSVTKDGKETSGG